MLNFSSPKQQSHSEEKIITDLLEHEHEHECPFRLVKD